MRITQLITQLNAITQRQFATLGLLLMALWCFEVLVPGVVLAQQASQPPVSAPAGTPITPKMPNQAIQTGVELDRVVAVANDAVILESDLDEERRLAAFQPFRDTRQNASREQVIDRLIDRALILQQAHLQPENKITDAQVDEQLTVLRKDIPACRQYHCDTAAGWQRFVSDQGFTMQVLRDIWRQRMEVLRFIEVRFRTGIHISDDEIQQYYQKTLLPQYAGKGATPPKLETISERIQEILLQQQVSSLLEDWLKSLRAQGTVRTIQPGEVAP